MILRICQRCKNPGEMSGTCDECHRDCIIVRYGKII